MLKKIVVFSIVLFIFFLTSCSNSKKLPLTINAGKIQMVINRHLKTSIYKNENGNKEKVTPFSYSEYISVSGKKVRAFDFTDFKKREFSDSTVYEISGVRQRFPKLTKKLILTVYKDFPDFIFTRVIYINNDSTEINVDYWVNNNYSIPLKDTTETVWSYQGATYEERPDWVMEIPNGFNRKNYLGMNATDYGGGIPVVDIWKRNYGIAIGHVENKPKLVSLPVVRKQKSVDIKIIYEKPRTLNIGDTLKTFETFVTVHNGDYFHTLKKYSEFMQKYRGIKFENSPKTAYQPIWCAWGYEREFTVNQILGTLPKVKELGYKWVVLDDGWQTAEGDWFLNPKKFPHGDKDMIAFVDKIHKAGLKAKLWWTPLSADPGTKLLKEHPELLLLDKKGKPVKISWWDSYYLCPAYKETLDYTRKMVDKFLGKWKFDGLKIDGQHLNGAPECYNPLHHHKRPEESVEAMPEFFKTIYDEAEKINPDAVIEVCPCGTAYNYYMLPYVNQVVASDPESSWQIRLKGKTFKALLDGKVPYYGDHVELSDGKDDFASTVGIGGIIGTKFVWPPGVHKNMESGDVSLTTAKEKLWQKWMKIFNREKLYEGKYLGELYDLGFDRPEAHVIQKGDTLYYSFYADKFNGEIILRGLNPNNKYTVFDYVNNKKIATLKAGENKLNVNFKKYLLVKAIHD